LVLLLFKHILEYLLLSLRKAWLWSSLKVLLLDVSIVNTLRDLVYNLWDLRSGVRIIWDQSIDALQNSRSCDVFTLGCFLARDQTWVVRLTNDSWTSSIPHKALLSLQLLV
jgi:hypothetical protein